MIRRLLLSLSLALLLAFGLGAVVRHSHASADLSPLRSPRAVEAPAAVARVSEQRLAQDIAQLQDDDSLPGADALRSRFTMAPGLAVEGAYAAAQLQAAGLAVSYQPFDATDRWLGVTQPVSNIVAIHAGLRPVSDGIYIVCAHYDSTAGREPDWASTWQTSAAPGADDNASGTAGVLEAARALADEPLGYEVRFVLFAGEEQGMQGAQTYARGLHEAGVAVRGVINLDMIGYDSNGDGRMEIHAGQLASSQQLAAVLARAMADYSPSLQPRILTAGSTDRSDHASFWQQGYPAVLAIEDLSDETPFYHRRADTVDSLNVPYCAAIVRAAVGALARLAAPPAPDLSPSTLSVAYGNPLLTTLAYTLTLRNAGALTATVAVTDALPAALTLDGPVYVESGVPSWDAAGRTWFWQGEVAPGGAVTVTYRARFDPWLLGGSAVNNTAQVDVAGYGLQSLEAAVRAPWRQWLGALSG